MNALNFLRDAQKYITSTPDIQDFPIINFSSFIQEYKTIALQLPRGSGKTTVANQLHNETSSLLYGLHPNLSFNYDTEVHKFRGRKFNGLKFNCAIFDEYRETPKDFLVFLIAVLMPANLVAKEFHIIRLYT